MGPTQSQVTPRAERKLLIRPCRYEMTESHEGRPLMSHEGYGLSVNVSDQGMLLLLPQPPQVQQVFDVLAPMPAESSPTAYVVEVRWTKQVAADEEGCLWLAGVRFLTAPHPALRTER